MIEAVLVPGEAVRLLSNAVPSYEEGWRMFEELQAALCTVPTVPLEPSTISRLAIVLTAAMALAAHFTDAEDASRNR